MANGISGSDFHGIGSLSCLCVRNDGGDGGLSVVSGWMYSANQKPRKSRGSY